MADDLHHLNFRKLAQVAQPFPVDRRTATKRMRAARVDEMALEFLESFPADLVFTSVDDFIESCHDVELFHDEAQRMPREFLRGAQG